VASIFRDFFNSSGQNVTKHTMFGRFFNLTPDDAIPDENNSLLTKLLAEITFPRVKFSVIKPRLLFSHSGLVS